MSRKICFSILLGILFIIPNNNFAKDIKRITNLDSDKPTNINKKEDSIPIYPNLIYEFKIAELNNLTPIELEYNTLVRKFIDVYTIKRREHLAKIIGLAELYFPIFEEALDKYELPLELKYLAIVESALDPRAISSSAAVGLWQFKINTSTMFDLEVNSYIDERCDPYKSTEAACIYLQYLYRMYNDWQLALAAYNGGPGVVRKAIQRSGGKTKLSEIYPYLPTETKGYVPTFIAVNYVMNHYKDHNIKPIRPKFIHLDVDSVRITKATSFERISEVIDIPIETLQFLNPSYRKDYIPEMSKGTTVVLPNNKISSFIKNEEAIFNKSIPRKNFNDVVAEAGKTTGKVQITHEVLRGEYFHKIAIKYNCTIDDIKAWNNLPTNNLDIGQKLNIWVNPELAKKIKDERIALKQQRSTTERFIFYTVQKGDTIYSIATKFNCSSIAELKEENNISNENDLKPGKKLKIFLNQ